MQPATILDDRAAFAPVPGYDTSELRDPLDLNAFTPDGAFVYLPCALLNASNVAVQDSQCVPKGMPAVHPPLRGPICGVRLGLRAALPMAPGWRVFSEGKATPDRRDACPDGPASHPPALTIHGLACRHCHVEYALCRCV